MSVKRSACGWGFIANPKTASAAMAGRPWVGGSGHATYRELGPTAPPGLWWWAFARHPADRLVSAYYGDEQGTDKDWREWVFALPGYMPQIKPEGTVYPGVGLLPQMHFLGGPDGGIGVDWVGRFERLERDWAWLCDRLQQLRYRLPRINTSIHRPWPSHYDTELLDVVWNLYRTDFENLEYTL